MNWFRVYTEITRDNKLRRLPPAQRWLWLAVLALARRSPIPGYLLLSPNVPVTFEDLADEAKVDIDEVREAFSYYESTGMIHIEDGVFVVTHWNKRQFESDDATARVQQSRLRRHNTSNDNGCNGDVTLQKRYSNDDETLQKRFCNVAVTPPDTDTESDIYKNSSSDDDELLASGDASESANLKERDPGEEKISGLTEYVSSPEENVNSRVAAKLTAGQKLFLVKFGRKRFATTDQAKAIAEIEADVGFEVLERALTWAAENNIRAVSSIRTAARKMARDSPLVPKKSVYDDPMFQRLQAEGKL